MRSTGFGHWSGVTTGNPVRSTLESLGIIGTDSVEEFHPRVRDRSDVRVLRCTRSGVLFLSDAPGVEDDPYSARSDFAYWDAANRREATACTAADDSRRQAQCADRIRGKRWLDVGTGAGGILDLLRGTAASVAAVEPQPGPRRALTDEGYQVFASVTETPERAYEVVTLFHVVEHLPDPVGTLRAVLTRLVAGGEVIVEVPHARDFLISFLDLPAFKDFTFWSEHLVLHTRDSLRRILAAAGFRDIEVRGFQRYPLENHLHWLATGRPRGHEIWAELGTPGLANAYAAMLDERDMTDTLIATMRR